MNEIEIMQQMLGSIAAASAHLDEQIAIFDDKIETLRRLGRVAKITMTVQTVMFTLIILALIIY